MSANRSDSKTTFCTVEGCGKPRRARLLCSRHYNQKYQPHKKVEFQCSACGETILRDQSAARWNTTYCSELCRTWGVWGKAKFSPLPPDHWARWYGTTSPWSPPPEKPRSFQSGQCDDCGALIVEPANQTPSRWCGNRCAKRVHRRARRARENDAPGSFRWTDVMRQYQRQGFTCAYCHQRCDGLPDPEHVVPLSRGGRNDMSNIVAACRPCNTDKRDLMLSDWNADRERRGLTLIDASLSGPAFYHLAA